MTSSQESGSSWRKQPRRSAGKQASAGSWQERQQAQIVDPVFKSRLKLALLGATAVGLIVALVAFVLLRPRSVHMLVVSVKHTQEDVPPNAFAIEDSDRFDPEYENFTLQKDVSPPGEKAAFLQTIRGFLASARPGGPGKNLVILYVSAHGVTDEQGNACLLLGESDPLRSLTWLPMAELFEVVTSSEFEHLRNANKLIFLDSGRISRNWSMGQLYNGFADALPNALKAANHDRLVVINSAGPGQQSYVSPQIGGSVFGFYVANALRGAAAPNDRQFSLDQLFEYIRDNVQGWSNANRPAPQVPMLIAENDQDFPVAYVADYKPLEPEPAPASGDSIRTLWSGHATALETDQPFRVDPTAWSRLGQMLVRLELLSLAGRGYHTEFEQESGQAAELIGRLKKSSLCEPFPGSSIALADYLAASGGNADEARKQWNVWLEHRKKPAEEQKKEPLKLTLDHQSAAAFVWQEILPKQPTQSQLSEALEFLRELPAAERLPYREVQLLRLMNDELDWAALGDELPWALDARRKSSQIAAPSDARAHYWTAPWQVQVDADLRIAEDCLFVGEANSLKEARERWQMLLGKNQSSGRLAEMMELSRLTSQAYSLRDEVWNSLADWGSWSTEPFCFRADPDLSAQVNQLANQTNALSKLLEQAPSGPPSRERIDELRGASDVVLNSVTELRSRFGKYVDDLVNSGDIQASFEQREAMLMLPTVSGPRRQSLRDQLVDQLEMNNDPGDDAIRKSLDDSEYVAWLANMTPHPALNLLGISPENETQPSTERAENIKRLAQQGGAVRRRLVELRETIVEPLVAKTREQLETSTEPIADARIPLAQADNILRPALALAVNHGWPGDADDPCRMLQRIDHHALLLWHGESCLSDFFGDGQGKSDSPFYALAVQQHINAAGKVWPETVRHRELLAESLRETREEFRTWDPLQVSDVHGSTTDVFAPHGIKFVAAKKAIPNGVPAIFVSSSESLLPLHESVDATGPGTVRRRPATVHKDKSFEHYFSKTDIGDENDFKAVCLYRGHIFTKSFQGKETNAAIVSFQRNDNRQASIRVRGGEKQTTQIVFVLDCSGSMAPKVGPSRMDGARKALKTVVDGLPIEDSNVEVTLVAYAHQSHWPNKKSVEPAPSPFFKRAKEGNPKLLLPHPSDDVEIFSFNGPRFNRDACKELKGIIDQLAPWGQTPLYFAVSQCLKQFRGIDGPKHLIVITDGDDDRYKPANAPVPKNDIDTANEALDPYKGLGVDVSFLLFSFEGKAAEFRRLVAPYPFVRVYEPNSEKSLADNIEQSLRLVDFTVEEKTAQKTKEGVKEPNAIGKRRINTVWPLPSVEPGSEYVTRLVNRDIVRPISVVLDGGEAVVLDFSSEKNRLEFPRFDGDMLQPARANLQYPNGSSDERYTVAIHPPDNSSGGTVAFRVSIQNQNPIEFTRRPKHLWAEVRPIFDENGSPDKPVFYVMDAQFEEELPVPVLRLQVAGWPDDAEWADIRLWFSIRPMELQSPVSINLDAREHRPIQLETATLRVDLRANREDGGAQLTLTEDHETANDFPLWIHVDPQPSQVTRAFVEEQRRVRHTYSFTSGDLRGVDKIQVRAVNREDVTKNWIEVSGLPRVPITSLGR